MKIIEQSHEIISLPDNLIQMIEQCGRTCYQSSDKIGCQFDECQTHTTTEDWHVGCKEYSCEYHSSQKFVKMIRDKKHDAMLEFGDVIVKFITNRSVTHELVRHRVGMSYAQESTRYVRYDKTSDGIGLMEFIRPVWMHKNVLGHYRYVHNHEELVGTKDPNENWINTMLNAERYYCLQIEAGWSPEKAREVLPNSLKTEIVVKANIREVRHIFQLRYRKKAHPQIRALMRPLMAELKQRVPVVFDDLYPEGERA